MAAAQRSQYCKRQSPAAIRSTVWLNEAATRRGELKLWRLRTFGCISGFLLLQLC